MKKIVNAARLIFIATFCLPLILWSAWNDGVGGENGFLVPNSGTQEIRQWSTCRRVQPVACDGAGIFVPTRTQLEWRQFTSNLPSCVTAPLINCY